MSKLADINVFPQTPFVSPSGEVNVASAYFADVDGMTLRQHYAGLALQGILANPETMRGFTMDAKSWRVNLPEIVGTYAQTFADALIAELEKTIP